MLDAATAMVLDLGRLRGRLRHIWLSRGRRCGIRCGVRIRVRGWVGDGGHWVRGKCGWTRRARRRWGGREYGVRAPLSMNM